MNRIVNPESFPEDSPNAEVTTGELAPLRQQLLHHPLYGTVTELPALRRLMSEHVFAVWDFMSLLKRMQQVVTCVQLPWMPNADSASARFILEIVLGEEADEDGRSGYASHFELYHQAMQELGADTRPIDQFLAEISAGIDLWDALDRADILPTTRDFVRYSLETALTGAPHEVAAAFFYGREDIIPDMFTRLVETIAPQGAAVDRFRHYLHRHIELDGDQHGPLAARLLQRLCANDPQKLAAADATACESLRRRVALWDGVYQQICG